MSYVRLILPKVSTPHELAAYILASRDRRKTEVIRRLKLRRQVMLQAAFLLKMQGHTSEAQHLWALQLAMYPLRNGRPRPLTGTSRVYKAYRPSQTEIGDCAYVRIPVMSLGVAFGEPVTAFFAKGVITLMAGDVSVAPSEEEGAGEKRRTLEERGSLEKLEKHRVRYAKANTKPGVPASADSVFALHGTEG